MGLFNEIDAKSACVGRKATRAVLALVALAHVLTGSEAHAQAAAAPSVSPQVAASHAPYSVAPPSRQGYFEALAAADVPPASRRALTRSCTHLDASRLRAAHGDLAWTAETSENAGDPLAADVVEAAGIKNPRKTAKAITGCASNHWTYLRLIQAWLRVPLTRTEHVSALVVVVRSPRGPPAVG
jgi:hypothetical protein